MPCFETVEYLPRARRRDPDASPKRCAARCALPLPQRWGKKPMCHVHVLDGMMRVDRKQCAGAG